MSVYASGKFDALTAKFMLGLADGETEAIEIAEGATLSDLVVAAGNYGSAEEVTIDKCVVKGFTMQDRDVKRGAVRSYDGVPMYKADPNAGQYRGFLQEVYEVRDLVVEVTNEEDGKSSELVVAADKIVSVLVGEKIDVVDEAGLKEAIENLEDGQVLVIEDDIDLTEGAVVVSEGKEVTIMLQGSQLSRSGNPVLFVENGAKVTLKGDGVLTAENNGGKGVVSVDGKGTELVLDGVKVEHLDGDSGYGIYCQNGGNVVLNSGEIHTSSAGLSGNNTTGDMSFEINGGVITADHGPAIYMPGQVALKMTGGVLNGGISLRMGQIDISGGEINSTADNIDSPAQYYNYSGNAWLPDALYVFGGTYTSENIEYGNSLNINITGGTFTCKNDQGSAIAVYDLGKVEQAANITIRGGEFFKGASEARNAYDVLSLADIGVTSPDAGYGQFSGAISSVLVGGSYNADPSAYVDLETYDVVEDEGVYSVVAKA